MRSLLSLALLFGALAAVSNAKDADHALDFELKSIDGKPVDLADYKGKVVLMVNTASQCGLTPQYAGLQQLYQSHKDQGLVVLGFPCNQFGSQEPGSEAQIKQFCDSKYNVTFPMFSKIEVNGDDADPLYKYLTSKNVKPAGDGPISWNFEKFLIDREGNLVHRFAPRTKPSDEELVSAVKEELSKK